LGFYPAYREDSHVKLLTWNDTQGKINFLHHRRTYSPEGFGGALIRALNWYRPAIETGFYYDVDFWRRREFSSDDFKQIEDKVLELARTKAEYIRKTGKQSRRYCLLH